MKRVFLSYTGSDKAFVERLNTDLVNAGLKVWWDSWDIEVGDSIVEKVDKALSTHDHFVVVLSPAAVRSRWVKKELNSALMRSLSDRRIKLLPVLYETCRVPTIISDIKYADFTKDYSTGFSSLTKALGLPRAKPAVSVEAKSVLGLLDSGDNDQLKALFPYSFMDFPECLFKDGSFDVSIVFGSTDRERTEETELFSNSAVIVPLFGTSWHFSRQVSPGTVRDAVRAVDLAVFLGYRYGHNTDRNGSFPFGYDASVCYMDLSVTQDALERNVILIGGADTNIYIAIAALAFREKFGYALPIRFLGDDQLYFTCDQIYSDCSKRKYSRIDDSSYMHCGYVLVAANPWSPSKVIILVTGSRATGTQAALLSLVRGDDFVSLKHPDAEPWHSLAFNNRFCPTIPAKVVRARGARVIQSNDFLAHSEPVPNLDQTRISQRHIITEFEFLE
jgi:hypothetical protein